MTGNPELWPNNDKYDPQATRVGRSKSVNQPTDREHRPVSQGSPSDCTPSTRPKKKKWLKEMDEVMQRRAAHKARYDDLYHRLDDPELVDQLAAARLNLEPEDDADRREQEFLRQQLDSGVFSRWDVAWNQLIRQERLSGNYVPGGAYLSGRGRHWSDSLKQNDPSTGSSSGQS